MKTNGELFSLGKGKFYREDGDLTLDVGPFAAALEFAIDRKATVVGKPDPAFFKAALEDMGVTEDEAVMVRTYHKRLKPPLINSYTLRRIYGIQRKSHEPGNIGKISGSIGQQLY